MQEYHAESSSRFCVSLRNSSNSQEQAHCNMSGVVKKEPLKWASLARRSFVMCNETVSLKRMPLSFATFSFYFSSYFPLFTHKLFFLPFTLLGHSIWCLYIKELCSHWTKCVPERVQRVLQLHERLNGKETWAPSKAMIIRYPHTSHNLSILHYYLWVYLSTLRWYFDGIYFNTSLAVAM